MEDDEQRSTNASEESSNSTLSRPQLSESGSTNRSSGSRETIESDRFHTLLPPEVQDTVQKTIVKLKSKNWETLASGLEDAVDVVRQHESALVPMISVINRALINGLSTPRTKVVNAAQEAAKEVFARMKVVCRPEFDEIVNLLLIKTADKNKSVRSDAQDALMAIVNNIPTKPTVRAITSKAPEHKNYLVRLSLATLLIEIIEMLSIETLFRTPSYKETRKSVMQSMAILLTDPNYEVRNLAKQAFEKFVNEPDFDEVFTTDVDPQTSRRIEKQLALLRYGKTLG